MLNKRRYELAAVFFLSDEARGFYNYDGEDQEQTPEFAPGEVLVKFKEGVELQKVLAEVEMEAKGVERVHSIKPVVARYRKEHPEAPGNV